MRWLVPAFFADALTAGERVLWLAYLHTLDAICRRLDTITVSRHNHENDNA